MANYAALWIPAGTTPWIARHGLTRTEFDSALGQFTRDGYLPVHVSGCAVNNTDQYAGVWTKAAGPDTAVSIRLPANEFDAELERRRTDGFRPAQVCAFVIGGNVQYVVRWIHDASFPWLLDRHLDDATYRSVFAARVKDGYRLVDITGVGIGPAAFYTAVWEKRPVTTWISEHGMSSDGYQDAFVFYLNRGYRLIHVHGFNVNGTDTYAAIWDKSPVDGWFARHRMTSGDYQQATADYTRQGYRPALVHGYSRGKPDGPVPDVTSSGVPVPALRILDDTMKRFVVDRGIPAAVLCVARNGTLVFERAYGWQDRARTRPLRTDALFRIASLSKPITAAAIQHLVRSGELSPADHAFDLRQPGGGILPLQPSGSPDSRLKDVTVKHLLEHTGGWNRDLSGDPMFDAIRIARALGVSSPPSQADTARYMMGRPLNHTPGSRYAYSNFGYLLLGLILEEVTSMDYTRFVQSTLLAPAGVPASEVELGRSLPSARNSREPWYSDSATAENVFAPGSTVPFPDGGFNLEAMEAHGGLISTARAYARFLRRYWIDGTLRDGSSASYNFAGSLPGTATFARQRPDGVDYVAFFNQRAPSSEPAYDEILDQLDAAVDSVQDWPATDVTSLPPARPVLQLQWPERRLRFGSESGRIYQVQESPSVSPPIWSDQGLPVVGLGSPLELPFTRPEPAPAARFLRVIVH